MSRKTMLYERHVALGGRMVAFAGWELPVQYPTGPLAEHKAVREAAGLFDIDHMGQVVISGPDALPFLQQVMTADVSAFPVGSANYSLMCYDDGGVVDEYPDTLVDYSDPERRPIAEAQGLQTNNPGFPGFRSSGFLVGTGLFIKVLY